MPRSPEAPAAGPPPGGRAAADFLKTYGFLLVALGLECLAFELIARRQGMRPFLSVDTLILVLNQSAIYGVVSVGMTFVILTGGIDLSVGSVIAFGGVVRQPTTVGRVR